MGVDDPRSLGIARVALTVQVTVAVERIEALLRAEDRALPEALAARVDAWVRERRLGYYPALEFLVDEGVVTQAEFDALRQLAATLRKRAKRDVQTRLWPVFSSVQIERAVSLAFTLPRLKPNGPQAVPELARHYFPNVVRIELTLATLDKQRRLEDIEAISTTKVMVNLREAFEAVTVTATRRRAD